MPIFGIVAFLGLATSFGVALPNQEVAMFKCDEEAELLERRSKVKKYLSNKSPQLLDKILSIEISRMTYFRAKKFLRKRF
ncbi:MAG: hypothetical protein H3Z51_04790 [archaeon]|nr:hypothetical protein [archaeon]